MKSLELWRKFSSHIWKVFSRYLGKNLMSTARVFTRFGLKSHTSCGGNCHCHSVQSHTLQLTTAYGRDKLQSLVITGS